MASKRKIYKTNHCYRLKGFMYWSYIVGTLWLVLYLFEVGMVSIGEKGKYKWKSSSLDTAHMDPFALVQSYFLFVFIWRYKWYFLAIAHNKRMYSGKEKKCNISSTRMQIFKEKHAKIHQA